MQRQHFAFGAAVACILLAGCLIYNFFHPKPRAIPQARIEASAPAQLASVAKALLGDSQISHRLPPAAITDDDGKPLLSWRVKILPYMGQFDLYRQFNLDEPWDSEQNKSLIEKMPDIYKSSLTGDLGGKTVYLVPTGPEMIFSGPDPINLDAIADGPANTIMLVEVDREHAVPWTKPDDLSIDRANPSAALLRLSNGNLNLITADGYSHTPRGTIDPALLWSLFTRAGGEKIEEPW